MTYAGAKIAITRNRHLTGLQQKAIMLFRAERPGKGFRLRCYLTKTVPAYIAIVARFYDAVKARLVFQHQPRFLLP